MHEADQAMVRHTAQVAGEAAAKAAEAGKNTAECNVQWSGKGGPHLMLTAGGLQCYNVCEGCSSAGNAV